MPTIRVRVFILSLKTGMASFLKDLYTPSLGLGSCDFCPGESGLCCIVSLLLHYLLEKCSLASIEGTSSRQASLFWGTRDLNQALKYARQVLYKLRFSPEASSMCGVFVVVFVFVFN